MIFKAIINICFISLACAVRMTPHGPSLSDPLGLNSAFPDFLKERPEYMNNSQINLDNLNAWNYDYVAGQIWPRPQKEARETHNYFSLDPKNFVFANVGQQSDVIVQALTRYKGLTFPDKDVKPDKKYPQMTKLQVKVIEPYKPMELKTDESYTLEVDAPTSTLTANTCWGALRGLETFSQLVHQNLAGLYFAQKNHIEDFPRFHHRGFLIDTSRHFINLKFILQFVDAMSYSKFNVLHWHIVDDQAFPFVSRTFPQMHKTASRDPVKSVYTPQDVQKVIDYGRLRGVRVLPEFDTPGHTYSWQSIPNLLTPCYSGGKPNGGLGPINPTIEENYVFLEKFFKEVGEVFPDPYMHLGGDEVPFGCWRSNPQITKWMKEHKMAGNYSLLEQYYMTRLTDIVGRLGKKYVVWQEVVDNGVKVKPDTVVNVWKGGWKKEMKKVTSMGLHSILSSCWYLDYISYGDDWRNYYKCDPHDFAGTKAEKDLVIGGTAALWGEFVDGVNLVSRAWGRAMSIGGRLWMPENAKDPAECAYKTWEHRCRYLRRGINADVLWGSQYCRHEWMNESK